MTRCVDAPPEGRVRAALDELGQRAGDNRTQPSVLALASKFDMSNTTFHRRHRTGELQPYDQHRRRQNVQANLPAMGAGLRHGRRMSGS